MYRIDSYGNESKGGNNIGNVIAALLINTVSPHIDLPPDHRLAPSCEPADIRQLDIGVSS